MSQDVTELKDLLHLKAPVPPLLAQVLGYEGNARYVSFKRIPIADVVKYSDGRVSAKGSQKAFLAYIEHPAVTLFLEGYDLGSRESEAKHALLLDRAQQEIYIAPIREVEEFLKWRWPQLSPSRKHQEENLAKIAIALKSRNPYDIEEMKQRIKEQRVLIETMLRWLDKRLKN